MKAIFVFLGVVFVATSDVFDNAYKKPVIFNSLPVDKTRSDDSARNGSRFTPKTFRRYKGIGKSLPMNSVFEAGEAQVTPNDEDSDLNELVRLLSDFLMKTAKEETAKGNNDGETTTRNADMKELLNLFAVGNVTAKPTEAQPTVAEPTVAEPTVAEPTVAEPAVAEPAVAEPRRSDARAADIHEIIRSRDDPEIMFVHNKHRSVGATTTSLTALRSSHNRHSHMSPAGRFAGSSLRPPVHNASGLLPRPTP